MQVAIMKEVGASKRIGHLIEGESLLNDGSAFVLFVIFKEMFTREEQRSAGDTVGYLFELVIVALLLGAAFGLVTTLVLALVYRCVSFAFSENGMAFSGTTRKVEE